MQTSNSIPIRISAVCRANEMRSRIVEGYLQKRHPEFDIRSFGTNVGQKGLIPSQLTREMITWGVEIRQTPPTSVICEFDFIKKSDIVISADDEISAKLARVGIASINICDFAVDDLHVPQDPIDFSSDKHLANAAKVIHCTARMISEVFDNESNVHSIWTHITSENAITDSLRNDAIVIDARLRHSSKGALSTGESRFFEEDELLSGSLISTLDTGTRIYAPRFEFREPEKTLLSDSWSDFVKALSNFGPLDVITTPLSVNGRELWDPYLASLVAEHVEYR